MRSPCTTGSRGAGSNTSVRAPRSTRRAATKEPTEPWPTTSHEPVPLAAVDGGFPTGPPFAGRTQRRARDPPDDLLDVGLVLRQIGDRAPVVEDDDAVAD